MTPVAVRLDSVLLTFRIASAGGGEVRQVDLGDAVG